MELDSAETLICRSLLGELAPWPKTTSEDFEARLRERSLYHGVQTLLHERLTEDAGWPPQLRDEFHGFAIGRTMWELRHQEVVTRALNVLAQRDIHAVLIKGSALAYTHYANPTERTRGDTDIIIPADSQDDATQALAREGFKCVGPITNEAVSIHSRHSWVGPDGDEHQLELHSRISLSQFVSRNLPYDQILRNAVPVAGLGPAALAHDPIDALLITCYHRTTHKHIPYYVDGKAYLGGNRLIWLYDIHLLTRSYTNDHWQAVIERATHRSLCAVTLEGLDLAHTCFGSSLPGYVREELLSGADNDHTNAYAAAAPIKQQWLDVLAIEGARRKLSYLKDAAFPSSAYMRSKYPNARLSWLPWLYLQRASDAAFKAISKRQIS